MPVLPSQTWTSPVVVPTAASNAPTMPVTVAAPTGPKRSATGGIRRRIVQALCVLGLAAAAGASVEALTAGAPGRGTLAFSAVDLDSSGSWFATPTANILCRADNTSLRCDVDRRKNAFKVVPSECVGRRSWGHVVVLDAEGARPTCPVSLARATDHPSASRIAYGTTHRYGAATCRSASDFLQCTRGGHGFRLSQVTFQVW